jgi:photosystem II stability/assembly factor-like uncharacterized protein
VPKRRKTLAILAVVIFAVTAHHAASSDGWEVQHRNLDTNLRGLSAIRDPNSNKIVVWTSGSNGTILLSVDEGKSWKRLTIPGGETLDFRAVVALDNQSAYAMSSGEGSGSRIYKTTDGFVWHLEYTGDRKEVFLDALVCPAANVCMALGDPVDGKFLILQSIDGSPWTEMPRGQMPAATAGEGAFAASGSCLIFTKMFGVYFGTGGGPAARVFREGLISEGQWTVSETPVVSGNASSGIFSVAGNERTFVAVGGDYKDPRNSNRAAAYSLDGGMTWQLASTGPRGYRSAVAHVGANAFVAVGPSGEDISIDNGAHWQPAGEFDLNAVSFVDPAHGWAVGRTGLIVRYVHHKTPGKAAH